MEEKRKRVKRSFSTEFKLEAIELTEKIGIFRASRELGLSGSTLRGWKRKVQSVGSESPAGKKSYSELEKEVRRLAKENGYLKEINKVLKKSTAIFSSDQLGDLK